MEAELLRAMTPLEGVDYRNHDCPKCGGKKCFSIKRESGRIKYYCFRASCSLKGDSRYTRSAEEIHQALSKESTTQNEEFIIPDWWQHGLNTESMLNLMKRYNSLDAYLSGYIKLGYDPKEDRLLFYITNKGKITGAIGRTLCNSSIKSRIYLNSTGVLTVGIGKILVVVEDPFSACSVSRDPRYTGCSLQGTNLTLQVLTKIKEYDKIIIALDKDASLKSLKIADYLRFLGKEVNIKLLDKDLKDCKQLPELE